MFEHAPMPALLPLLLVSLSLSCAQCEDAGARSDGWRLGDDAGVDASSDAGPRVDASSDVGPGADVGPEYSLACTSPSPSEPSPDLAEQVLLANSELGQAFGHVHRRSSWGVADISSSGEVELGAEYVFDPEQPLELFPSDDFAYLASGVEPRVVLLDATMGFAQIGDYQLPAPPWVAEANWAENVPLGAAYSQRVNRHYIAFSNATFAVVGPCTDGTASVRYLDLRDILGAEAQVTSLEDDGAGYLVGTVQNSERSKFFVLSPAANGIVQRIDLPEPVHSSHIQRLASGDLVVSVGRGQLGTLDPGVSGGLLLLQDSDESNGRRLLGEYLVTAEELGGNPLSFMMLDEDSGIVQVFTELGAVPMRFEREDDSITVTRLEELEGEIVHICADSMRREVWFPSNTGLYRLDVEADTITAIGEQFDTLSHHCLFAP